MKLSETKEHHSGSIFKMFIVFLIFIIPYFAIQIYISKQYNKLSSDTEESFSKMKTQTIDDYKKIEETIALKINNRGKKIFWATFIANLSASLGIVAGLATIWIGAWKCIHSYDQYLHTRRDEYHDRLSTELSVLWKGVASSDQLERAGSIAGLQDFLGPEKSDFHHRTIAAIALIGRMQSIEEETQDQLSKVLRRTYHHLIENTKAVTERKRLIKELEVLTNSKSKGEILLSTLTPVVEYALRVIDPQIIKSVSWRGVRLNNPNFSGLNLDGIDLRDSFLENANFTDTTLDNARLDAACLKGADFSEASLVGANMQFADIAGAKFINASLKNAVLENVKLLDADLENTIISNVKINWNEINISHTKNWRKARFFCDDDTDIDRENGIKLREKLLKEFGEKKDDKPNVLMFMWEMDPIVSGGGWTAAYHLVKNVCRKGVKLTIVIPWLEKHISREIFGNEVELIPVGVETTTKKILQYDNGELQNKAPVAYSGTYDTDDSIDINGLSTYSVYTYNRTQAEIVNQYTQNALHHLKMRGYKDFDVIHAHDWLTFKIASQIAKLAEIPWVAHFHSLEADRRKKATRWISMIEQEACDNASAIVTPSNLTKERLIKTYKNVSPEKITVVYNCLSKSTTKKGNIVDIDNGHVVFAGRMSWQKGINHFIQIARNLQRFRPKTKFSIIGSNNYATHMLYNGQCSQMRQISTLELLKETDPNYRMGFLEPMDDLEIEGNIKQFKNIIPVKINPHNVNSSSKGELIDSEEKTNAIKELLQSGVSFIKTKRKIDEIDYNYLAIPDDHEKVKVDGYYVNLKTEIQIRSFKDAITVKPFKPWAKRFEVFNNASAVVVPSRHEPFGMIILEAMQAGVPVFVSSHAGANEILEETIKINENKHFETAKEIAKNLWNCSKWKKQVEKQFDEINDYDKKNFEDALINLWEGFSV